MNQLLLTVTLFINGKLLLLTVTIFIDGKLSLLTVAIFINGKLLSLTVMMMNCFVVWLTDEMRLALFPAGTIVRNPHHLESPTHREQDLNLRRT